MSDQLNIMIIGSGAREHALAWQCRQSPFCGKLSVSPANPAIETIAHSIDSPDSRTWHANSSDLVICGPEQPIASGKIDELLKAGFKVFAPNKSCARLEDSKRYAKDLMAKVGIPTADYRVSTDQQTTIEIARGFLSDSHGVVLKASGLAAGKGVFVCRSSTEIDNAVAMLYSDRLSKASHEVVIEEIIDGRECSFFTLLGHGQPYHLGFAVDYKRLAAGDQGPNTGGMGSYCPVPWLPTDAEQQVVEQILTPLQPYLESYVGCLYVGLMWTTTGPKVLEFNVRFGDPETQALVVASNGDWLPIIANLAGHNLDCPTTSGKQRPTIAVVLTSAGYPYHEDHDSVRLPKSLFVGDDPDCHVFGASLNRDGEHHLRTGNGRVLTVVASGQSHGEARQRVYRKVEEILGVWQQAHFRNDIGEELR